MSRLINCAAYNAHTNVVKPGKHAVVVTPDPDGVNMDKLIEYYSNMEMKNSKSGKPQYKIEYTDDDDNLRNKWSKAKKHKCIPAEALAISNLRAASQEAERIARGVKKAPLKSTVERNARKAKTAPTSLGYFGTRSTPNNPGNMLHLFGKDIVRTKQMWEYFTAHAPAIMAGTAGFDFNMKNFNKMSSGKAMEELKQISPGLAEKLVPSKIATVVSLTALLDAIDNDVPEAPRRQAEKDLAKQLLLLTLHSKGTKKKQDAHREARNKILNTAEGQQQLFDSVPAAAKKHLLPKLTGYKDLCNYLDLSHVKQRALTEEFAINYRNTRLFNQQPPIP